MTEFEFLTAIGDAFGFSVQAAMGFFTVFGAYVLTAHFAGKALSKPVAISISVLYSIFLSGPVTGIFLAAYKVEHLENLYFEQYPAGEIVRSFGSPEILLFIIAFPLLLGWLASLVYMHGYIRKNVRAETG